MTIELPEEQVRRLADVCRREGVSRAEVVRRAVADYLDARYLRDRDDMFGIGGAATWMVCGTSAVSGASGREWGESDREGED